MQNLNPLWRFTPLAMPMGVSVLLIIILISLGARRRQNPLAIPYLFFMGELLIWMSTSLLEILTLDHTLSQFLADLSFLGVAFLPVTWLTIVLVYTDKRRLLTRWLPALLLVPVLTNLMIWTNSQHHLWRGESFRDLTTTWFPITVYQYGPWFYAIYLPYAYLVTLAATILLVWALIVKGKVYRAQISIMLTALYLPLSIEILHRLGYELVPHFNASTLIFPISGLLLGWSLLRFQFLNLTPIARERVIENMESLLLVVDQLHQIVDINPAARSFFALNNQGLIGKHLQELFPNQGELVQRISTAFSLRDEIKLDRAGELHTFELQVSPIRYRSGNAAGQLILLNNISERKATEQMLHEQSRQIAILEERRRIARDLHDSVNQTLFAASTLADLLPIALDKKPEKLREYASSIRQLTQGATAQMRLILLELYPDALLQTNLGTILRHLCLSFTGDTGTPIDYAASPHIHVESDVQMAFYRIAQEALQNTRKHADASHVSVRLLQQDAYLELVIQDNGRGFDVGRTLGGQFGVRNMHERAQAVGATLSIISQANQGTTIKVMKANQ